MMRFKPEALVFVLAAGLLLAGGLAFSTQEAARTDVEFAAAVQALNNYGLVARTWGALQVLNPTGNTVGAPLFDGQLGSEGGGLFDVVISANGKRAAVSNFGDSKVFFIDFTNPASPQLIGVVRLPFFAEDLAITPDGKYLLCTDGGFSSRVAVIEFATQTVATDFRMTGGRNANAVEIAADGRTVFTVDYFSGKVQILILNPATGALSYGKLFILDGAHLPAGVALPPDFRKAQFFDRPVNVSISPNGKTAVIADANMDQIVVFRIDSPWNVTMTQITGTYPRIPQYSLPWPTFVAHGQSFAFTPDGKKLYGLIQYVRTWLDQRTEVAVYDVVGPGKLKPTYVTIPITPTRGTSQLFGVDCMAVDPSGRFLYVTNPTLSGGQKVISIIKVATNAFLHNIWLVNDPPPNDMQVPVGIAFRRQ